MRRADQITGVVVLIFSLAVIEGAPADAAERNLRPGRGVPPLLARSGHGDPLDHFAGQRDPGAGSGFGPLPIPEGPGGPGHSGAIGGSAAFILLLETLGFLVSIALLTAFLLRCVERVRWLTTATVAVGNAIGMFVVFRMLLGVSLPKNIFGF